MGNVRGPLTPFETLKESICSITVLFVLMQRQKMGNESKDIMGFYLNTLFLFLYLASMRVFCTYI